MAETTEISWCDSTMNPWIGCTKVSPGCDNCYAATQDKFRKWTPEGWGGPRQRTSAANWKKPLQWNRDATAFQAQHGRRQRVFCASLADVFDNEVPEEWRFDLYELWDQTPHLDWLVLTKRIGNAAKMLPWVADNDQPGCAPLPNVWLGATIVNQEEADRDIPKLLAVPARVRFLSCEPLLGPVDLRTLHHDGTVEINALTGDHGVTRPLAGRSDRRIDWVIVGGESGPGARPMHPAWARSLRDQCAAADVPFHFKQWGEWAEHVGRPCGDLGGQMRRGTAQLLHAPGNPEGYFRRGDAFVERVGKQIAGRLLDGVTHDAFPAVSADGAGG